MATESVRFTVTTVSQQVMALTRREDQREVEYNFHGRKFYEHTDPYSSMRSIEMLDDLEMLDNLEMK